jgi:hypothetical protein
MDLTLVMGPLKPTRTGGSIAGASGAPGSPARLRRSAGKAETGRLEGLDQAPGVSRGREPPAHGSELGRAAGLLVIEGEHDQGPPREVAIARRFSLAAARCWGKIRASSAARQPDARRRAAVSRAQGKRLVTRLRGPRAGVVEEAVGYSEWK